MVKGALLAARKVVEAAEALRMAGGLTPGHMEHGTECAWMNVVRVLAEYDRVVREKA